LIVKRNICKKTPYLFLRGYFKRGNPETYFENGLLQCEEGRGRSLGDLMMLLKHYFPNVTQREAIRALAELDGRNILNSIHCGTIKTVAFHQRHRYKDNSAFCDHRDFGEIINPSSIDLLQLINT